MDSSSKKNTEEAGLLFNASVLGIGTRYLRRGLESLPALHSADFDDVTQFCLPHFTLYC